jgi:MATE family multidrug resistance protein
MGILIQTFLIYVFPSALSLGVSTRIGNEIGANRLEKARIPMVVSLVWAIGLGLPAMLWQSS